MNFKHTGKFVLATAFAVFFVFSILGIHNVVTSSGGVAFFGRVARDIKNSFHFGLGFLSNSRAAVLGAGSELILNWQFDEFGGSLASDASSNGRHGNVSLENPFTYIARDFRSIQFNGSNLYVYNHALPAQSGDFSVSLWFKTNAGGTVFEYANSSNSGVRLYFENEILKMGGSGGPSTVLSQGADIADAKWHHTVNLMLEIRHRTLNILMDLLTKSGSMDALFRCQKFRKFTANWSFVRRLIGILTIIR